MFRVSNENWDDEDYVLSQVKKKGENYFKASPRIQKNIKFWRNAVQEYPNIYEDVFILREDKIGTILWLKAIRNANHVNLISSRLKTDIDVVKAIGEIDPYKATAWADNNLLRNIKLVKFLWEKSNHDEYFLLDIDSDIRNEILEGKGSFITEIEKDTEDHQIKPTRDFSYLFKNNIHKLALSLYKGKKSSVTSLFKLYSYIVDIRSNDIEEANLFRGKTLPLWKTVLKEQSKQFTPEEKVTATITQSLQVIDAYFKKNTQPLDSPSLQQEKVTLYKASRYKTLIVNLLQYLISFFNHMGIRVKPLQIVSDVSNIKVIGLMADTVEESPVVSQLLSQVSTIKDKLTQNFFSSIDLKLDKHPKKEIKGIEYYEHPTIGFISLETLKTYSTLEELLADVKKEKILDKNYSQLQVSQGKVILPSKNKVIKAITYFNPEELKAKIKEYQNKIDEYNYRLESYEKKLSNTPKTIQLGDHQVNTVKILDRNISRLVVIDGPYQGHFVDELVSSTGEVIESASKATAYLTETSKVLKKLDKFDIESVFSEPIEFSNLEKVLNYKPGNVKALLKKSFALNNRKYLEDLKSLRIDLSPEKLWDITGSTILYNLGKNENNTTSTIEEIGQDDFSYKGYLHEVFNSDGGILMQRGLFFKGKTPYSIKNEYFNSDPCLPEGLGTRIFTQQVKSASEAGFQYISTMAAKSKSGNHLVGYYVWPKLGYNSEIPLKEKYLQFELKNKNKKEELEREIGKRKNKSLGNTYDIEHIRLLRLEKDYKELKKSEKKFKVKYQYLVKWLEKNSSKYSAKDGVVDILEIYACKYGDRFIGQEFWKEFGDTTNMEFDLTPNSLSMRILEAYITLKSKKEGIDPKDYLNIDYSRMSSKNLTCVLTEQIPKTKEIDESIYNSIAIRMCSNYLHLFENNIKNYENGEFVKIYNNPKLKPFFMAILKRFKETNPEIAKDILLILSQKGIDNIKLASRQQQSEDPMIREVDFDILDKVWDGINKLYEAGNFK